MFNVESGNLGVGNVSKVLLTEQDVAKRLGVPKKDIQAMITAGILPVIALPDRNLISSVAVDNLIGKKDTADSGQLGHGYPVSNALYYHQENNMIDSEDEIMREYTGNVSVLSDGRCMVQINLGKGPDGKRKRESKSFKSKVDAEKYLEQRLNELNGLFANAYPFVNNECSYPQKQTMVNDNSHYMDQTFEAYAKYILNRGIRCAGSRTIEGYRASLVPVLKQIGKIKMVNISEEILRKLFNDLSYNYHKTTLKKAFVTSRMIFNEAYAKDLIPNNPFGRLECPKSRKVVDAKNTSKKPYTNEEIEVLFTAAKEYHNRMVYPLLTTAECTGMRPSELRALYWEDFSPENKTINIYKAIASKFEDIDDMYVKPYEKEYLTVTKSEYGVRELQLSDLAVEALLQWRKELNKMPPAMKNSKFIFPSEEGDFKSYTSVKSILQRFLKHYDLKYIKFTLYRFRHTMCTRLALDGIPVSVAQRIMGDNTIDVIMKVYTHVSNQQALEACGPLLDKVNEVHRAMSRKHID